MVVTAAAVLGLTYIQCILIYDRALRCFVLFCFLFFFWIFKLKREHTTVIMTSSFLSFHRASISCDVIICRIYSVNKLLLAFSCTSQSPARTNCSVCTAMIFSNGGNFFWSFCGFSKRYYGQHKKCIQTITNSIPLSYRQTLFPVKRKPHFSIDNAFSWCYNDECGAID